MNSTLSCTRISSSLKISIVLVLAKVSFRWYVFSIRKNYKMKIETPCISKFCKILLYCKTCNSWSEILFTPWVHNLLFILFTYFLNGGCSWLPQVNINKKCIKLIRTYRIHANEFTCTQILFTTFTTECLWNLDFSTYFSKLYPYLF